MKNIKFTIALFLFIGIFSQASAQYVSDVAEIKTTLKNEDAKIFNQLVNHTKDPQIIDIRTPREYVNGHIKGAVLINYYDPNFAKNIKKHHFDKSKPVFIYCRSGHRSGNSINIFKKLGFKHIVNLTHGLNEWKRLQLPLEY
jgi:rhodanese-related sulfurtransferase